MTVKINWQDAISRCQKSAEPWVMATVMSTLGSTPRNSGSKMLITADDTFDTVGGGQLEFNIILLARKLIEQGEETQRIETIPLSVKAQQCCGGTMTVLLECFAAPTMNLHIFGAGHVAKALVTILGQLDAKITWLDDRRQEFPEHIPSNTTVKCLSNIVEHIHDMPANAWAIVLTHRHSLDYELLEALLDRKDCRYIGMIGSNTKALRFKKRLKSASFSEEEIASVHCPIGLQDIGGKLPMEIAVSIAGQLIQNYHDSLAVKKRSGVHTEALAAIESTDNKSSI